MDPPEGGSRPPRTHPGKPLRGYGYGPPRPGARRAAAVPAKRLPGVGRGGGGSPPREIFTRLRMAVFLVELNPQTHIQNKIN